MWDKQAYWKRTNVTTEEERTHQQGWPDTPEIDTTMTALSDLELESITSGTKEKIQTNTEGDRVPEMTWSSSSPTHHWKYQYGHRVGRESTRKDHGKADCDT